MAYTIPVIITNDDILVKRKGKNEFIVFNHKNGEHIPNVPPYHSFAKDLAHSSNEFKNFINEEYSLHFFRPFIVAVVPDDSTPLEIAFLKSFFANNAKAVVTTRMSQVLTREHEKYISLSKSIRSISLQYVNHGEIFAERYYDSTSYNIAQIKKDITRIHIDADYDNVPVLINNMSDDMFDFADMGELIFPDTFRRTVCDISLEKI